MRTGTRHQAMLAVTLVALLGTAACGSSDDSEPEAASRQPPSAPEPSAAPSEDAAAEEPSDGAADPDPSDVPEESDPAAPAEEAPDGSDDGADDGGADDPAGALPDTDDVLGAPAEAVAAVEARITAAETTPLSVAQVEGIETAARDAGAADNNGTSWMVGLYPTEEVGIYQVTVYTPGLVELWEVPGDGSQATDAGDSGLDPADPSFAGWQVHAGEAAQAAMDAVGGEFVHQIHVLEAESPVMVVVVETPGDHMVRVGIDGVTGEPLNAVAI